MSQTDRDAVEALAQRHDDDANAWACDGGRSDLARYHRDTAAMLRALMAERDALLVQRGMIRAVLDKRI